MKREGKVVWEKLGEDGYYALWEFRGEAYLLPGGAYRWTEWLECDALEAWASKLGDGAAEEELRDFVRNIQGPILRVALANGVAISAEHLAEVKEHIALQDL